MNFKLAIKFVPFDSVAEIKKKRIEVFMVFWCTYVLGLIENIIQNHTVFDFDLI